MIRCRVFGHKKRPIKAAVEKQEFGGLLNFNVGTSKFFTMLLSRCERCGEHVTEVYDGEWTLADFERKTSEREEFERIAGE